MLGNAARRDLPPYPGFSHYGGTDQWKSRPRPGFRIFGNRRVSGAHPRFRENRGDGCNRFCSYCIIPPARKGPVPPAGRNATGKWKGWRRRGIPETVLVGINLTAYGQDCGLTLCDAVESVCAVGGIRRVRLGSLEPDAPHPRGHSPVGRPAQTLSTVPSVTSKWLRCHPAADEPPLFRRGICRRLRRPSPRLSPAVPSPPM